MKKTSTPLIPFVAAVALEDKGLYASIYESGLAHQISLSNLVGGRRR